MGLKETRDLDGNTLMHYIARQNNMDAAVWLMKKRGLWGVLKNNYQESPYDIALENDNEILCDIFTMSNICKVCFWPCYVEVCNRCGGKNIINVY